MCWPYRDGGFAALAPLCGAKASAAAAPARPLFAAESGLAFPPWLEWLLPREAGLRRQSRHPCKANTERRSGRGTRVCGVIPSRFCCPAAIKYPAGTVSSHWFESLAVVPSAAFGGGGNGSGTKRRLVLAVGFQGACPWPLFRAFLAGQKGTASDQRFERNKNRRKRNGAEISIPAEQANLR